MNRHRKCNNQANQCNQSILDCLKTTMEMSRYFYNPNSRKPKSTLMHSGYANSYTNHNYFSYVGTVPMLILLPETDGVYRCDISFNMKAIICSHHMYTSKLQFINHLISTISKSTIKQSTFNKTVSYLQNGLCKTCAFILTPQLESIYANIFFNSENFNFYLKLQLFAMYIIECMKYYPLAKYVIFYSTDPVFILRIACKLLNIVHIYHQHKQNAKLLFKICHLLWTQIVRNFYTYLKYYKCIPYIDQNKNNKSQFTELQWDILVRDINLYHMKRISIAMEPFFKFILHWTLIDLQKYWLFSKSDGKDDGLFIVLNVFIQCGIICDCDYVGTFSEQWMKELINIRFQNRKLHAIGVERGYKQYTMFWKNQVLLMRKTIVIPSNPPLNWPDFKKLFDSMIHHIGCLYETGKVARENSFVLLKLLYDRNQWDIKDCLCLWQKCDKKKRNQKLFKCSGCKMAKYCSRKCQKKDWNKGLHSVICKRYKAY
eukprot:90416_1